MRKSGGGETVQPMVEEKGEEIRGLRTVRRMVEKKGEEIRGSRNCKRNS